MFHGLKAMQDVHLCTCMYVCIHMHVCMYIYVLQGGFRLMSFTAGRCGTPLIVSVSLSRPSGSKGLYEPNRTDRSVLL